MAIWRKPIKSTESVIRLVNLKHHMIIGIQCKSIKLLSALSADIGENKCGTVMTKLVSLITNTPTTFLNVGNYIKLPKGNIAVV